MVQTKTYCSSCGGVRFGSRLTGELPCTCSTHTTITGSTYWWPGYSDSWNTYNYVGWQKCPVCKGKIKKKRLCHVCEDKGIISVWNGKPPQD